MYYDVQSFPSQGDLSHVGSPSATVECKLVNVKEEDVAAGVYRGEVSAIPFQFSFRYAVFRDCLLTSACLRSSWSKVLQSFDPPSAQVALRKPPSE